MRMENLSIYISAFWEVVSEHGLFVAFILLGSFGFLASYHQYRKLKGTSRFPKGLPQDGVAARILENVAPQYVGGVVGHDLGQRLADSVKQRPVMRWAIPVFLTLRVLGIPLVFLLLS